MMMEKEFDSNIGIVSWLDDFASEVQAWTNHNFPKTPAYRPLLGMSEELGEIAEIIHPLIEFEKDTINAILDGVGDYMVFLQHYDLITDDAIYLRQHGIGFMEVHREVSQYITVGSQVVDMVTLLNSFVMVVEAHGYICRNQLKTEQGIRQDDDCSESDPLDGYVRKLISSFNSIVVIASRKKLSLFDVTYHTWQKVKQRDWVKFPKNGVSE